MYKYINILRGILQGKLFWQKMWNENHGVVKNSVARGGQSEHYEVKSGQSLHIKIKKTFAPL